MSEGLQTDHLVSCSTPMKIKNSQNLGLAPG